MTTSNIPRDIYQAIAEQIDPTLHGLRDLLNLCSAHPNLCKDDNFWRRLYQRLHPEVTEEPLETWRLSYITLIKSQDISLKQLKTSTEVIDNLVDVEMWMRRSANNLIMEAMSGTMKRAISGVDVDNKVFALDEGEDVYAVYDTGGQIHLSIPGETDEDEDRHLVIPYSKTVAFQI